MFCSACKNDLPDCTCPDIDERLAKLQGPNSRVLTLFCIKCDKHKDRCRCEVPDFRLSNDPAIQAAKQ